MKIERDKKGNNMSWQNQFKNRIQDFEKQFGNDNGIPISIKIRSSSCYCREHCAEEEYKIIDSVVAKFDSKKEHAVLIEHESGPEILVYISLSIDILSLSASIISLIYTLINTRKKIKSGFSFKLSVRNFDSKGNLREEKVLEFDQELDKASIKMLLEKGIEELLKNRKG